MKTLMRFFIAGVAFAVVSPAFAGRDQTQIMEQQRVMKAKQAEQRALAEKAQAGLAGATGVPGKVGPGTQKPRAGRIDPSAHP